MVREEGHGCQLGRGFAQGLRVIVNKIEMNGFVNYQVNSTNGMI